MQSLRRHKFKRLIDRLTNHEINEALTHKIIHKTRIAFISGGIYAAIVDWCGTTNDATHLKPLAKIDAMVNALLSNQ